MAKPRSRTLARFERLERKGRERVLGVGSTSGGSASVGADPGAVVGLTVVNGSAGTFMRSDAAPPIADAVRALMVHSGPSPPTKGEVLWYDTTGGTGFAVALMVWDGVNDPLLATSYKVVVRL